MTTKRVVVNLTEQEAEVCQAMADVPLTVSRDFDRGYLVLELEVPEHWDGMIDTIDTLTRSNYAHNSRILHAYYTRRWRESSNRWKIHRRKQMREQAISYAFWRGWRIR